MLELVFSYPRLGYFELLMQLGQKIVKRWPNAENVVLLICCCTRKKANYISLIVSLQLSELTEQSYL